MKRKLFFFFILLSAISVFISLSCQAPENKSVLQQGQTITLPNVKGRIDHMAYDADGQKLFICALENNSVEVVDLKKNNVLASIKNLEEPQGIVFVPERKKIYVACGGDGYLHVFDSEKFLRLDSVYVGDDADNVRFDSIAQKIYVGSDAGLTVINLNDLRIITTIGLEGHPESFQIDHAEERIFVNDPEASEIEVFNLKTDQLIVRWPISNPKKNFPMAVDEKTHRIYVGCRRPAKVLVIDDHSGNILSVLDCAGDADDLFYDYEMKHIIVSCGEGFIDVFADEGQNKFSQVDHVGTRLLARTSLYIPSEKKFILALPSGFGDPAEIRTYTLIP